MTPCSLCTLSDDVLLHVLSFIRVTPFASFKYACRRLTHAWFGMLVLHESLQTTKRYVSSAEGGVRLVLYAPPACSTAYSAVCDPICWLGGNREKRGMWKMKVHEIHRTSKLKSVAFYLSDVHN